MRISFRIGNPRKDQDLGEEEYRAGNDDDAQRSNNSDENNNQDNDYQNYRGIEKSYSLSMIHLFVLFCRPWSWQLARRFSTWSRYEKEFLSVDGRNICYQI